MIYSVLEENTVT